MTRSQLFILKRIYSRDSGGRFFIVFRNAFQSFIYKALTFGVQFLLVSYSLDLLGKNRYGQWMTIFSLLTWFSLFDSGFTNSLKLELAKVLNHNLKRSRNLVSTAYFILGIISITLLFLLLLLQNEVTLYLEKLGIESNAVVVVLFVSVCLQLVLNLLNAVYAAKQKFSRVNLLLFIISFLSLIFILLLKYKGIADSVVFSLYASVLLLLPNIVYLISTILFFLRNPEISPKLFNLELGVSKTFLRIGFKFLILQLFGIIIFQSLTLLISYFYTSEIVAEFSVLNRYYFFGYSFFTLLITPFSTYMTQALLNKDYGWIRKGVFYLFLICGIFFIILFIQYLIIDWFFDLWLGEFSFSNPELKISLLMNFMFFTWNTALLHLFNSFGLLKSQILVCLTGILIFACLILFFKNQQGLLQIHTLISANTIAQIFMGVTLAVTLFLELNNEKKTI